ncbi:MULTISPECIES: ParA family partition ATPase [Pseudomonas]|nr:MULTISPECIES: ParA family partition ATPase [Pseudomonas]
MSNRSNAEQGDNPAVLTTPRGLEILVAKPSELGDHWGVSFDGADVATGCTKAEALDIAKLVVAANPGSIDEMIKIADGPLSYPPFEYTITYAILNQKGGAGKTTTAVGLGEAMAEVGLDTVLVDSDPQGTARDWEAMGVASGYPLGVRVVGVDRPVLDKSVPPMKEQFRIIDGASKANELTMSAIKAADIVIIPVQPSPPDIWGTSDLVNMIKMNMEAREGGPRPLKAFFLITQAEAGTILYGLVGQALAGYGLPILRTRLSDFQEYKKAPIDGRTPMTAFPRGQAANELRQLRDEVLRKSKR